MSTPTILRQTVNSLLADNNNKEITAADLRSVMEVVADALEAEIVSRTSGDSPLYQLAPAQMEPPGVSAVLTDDGNVQITVGWLAVSQASSYELGYAFGGATETVVRYGTLSAVFTLLRGMTYSLRVRAVNGIGVKGAWSSSTSGSAPINDLPPSTPGSVTTTGGIGAIMLRWSAPPEQDASHYEIFESDNNATPVALTPASFITTQLFFSRVGLPSDAPIDLWYSIRAVNTSGRKSEWSTPVQGSTVSIASVDQVARDAADNALEAAQANGESLAALALSYSATAESVDGITSAVIGFRAKAGEETATLELAALSDPTGSASVLRVAADEIILNGSVTVEKLDVDSFNLAGLGVFGGRLESANYELGSAGWAIDVSGEVEFNSLVVREDMIVDDAVSRTVYDVQGATETDIWKPAGSYWNSHFLSNGVEFSPAPYQDGGQLETFGIWKNPAQVVISGKIKALGLASGHIAVILLRKITGAADSTYVALTGLFSTSGFNIHFEGDQYQDFQLRVVDRQMSTGAEPAFPVGEYTYAAVAYVPDGGAPATLSSVLTTISQVNK